MIDVRDTPNKKVKKESLSLYIQTIYNDNDVFELLQRLYTEKLQVGRDGIRTAKIQSTVLLKKILTLSNTQKKIIFNRMFVYHNQKKISYIKIKRNVSKSKIRSERSYQYGRNV